MTYKPSGAESAPPGRQPKTPSGTAFLKAKKAARDAAQRSKSIAVEEAERAYTDRLLQSPAKPAGARTFRPVRRLRRCSMRRSSFQRPVEHGSRPR